MNTSLRYTVVKTTEERQKYIPPKYRGIKPLISNIGGLRVTITKHLFERLNWPHNRQHPIHPGGAKFLTSGIQKMAEHIIEKIKDETLGVRATQGYLMRNSFYNDVKSNEGIYGVIVYRVEPRIKMTGDKIKKISSWKLKVLTMTREYQHKKYEMHRTANRYVDTGILEEEEIVEPKESQKEIISEIDGKKDYSVHLEKIKNKIIDKIDIFSKSKQNKVKKNLNRIDLTTNDIPSLVAAGEKLLIQLERLEKYSSKKKNSLNFDKIKAEIQHWVVPGYLKSLSINNISLDNIQKSWWTILKQITFPSKVDWQDIIENNELDRYDIPIEQFSDILENGKLTNSARASLQSLDLMLNGIETAIENYKESGESNHGFLSSLIGRLDDIDEVEKRIKKARKIYNKFYERLPSLKKLQPFNDIIAPKNNQSEKEYVVSVLNKMYQDFISSKSETDARKFAFITDFGVTSSKKISPQHDTLETNSFFRKWLKPNKIIELIENRNNEAEQEAFNTIKRSAEQRVVNRIRTVLNLTEDKTVPDWASETITSQNVPYKISDSAEKALMTFREVEVLRSILKYLIKDKTLMTQDNPLFLWKDKPRALEYLMLLYKEPRNTSLKIRQFTMNLRGTGTMKGSQPKRAWAQNKIIQHTSSRSNPSIWGQELITQDKYTNNQNEIRNLKNKERDISEYNKLSSKNNLNESDSNRLEELKNEYGETKEFSIKDSNRLLSLQQVIKDETVKRHKAATEGMKSADSDKSEDYREWVTTYSKLFDRFKGKKVSSEELTSALEEEGLSIDESLVESLSVSNIELDTSDFINNIENDLVKNLAQEMLITFANTRSKEEYRRHMSDFFEPEGTEDYIADVSQFNTTDPDAFPKAFATWLTIHEKILNKSKTTRTKLSKAIIEDFPKNIEKGVAGRALKRRVNLLLKLDTNEKENLAGVLPSLESNIKSIEDDISNATEGIRASLQDIIREMLNTVAANTSNEGAGSTPGIKIKLISLGKTKKGHPKAKRTTVRGALIAHGYLVPIEEEEE